MRRKQDDIIFGRASVIDEPKSKLSRPGEIFSSFSEPFFYASRGWHTSSFFPSSNTDPFTVSINIFIARRLPTRNDLALHREEKNVSRSSEPGLFLRLNSLRNSNGPLCAFVKESRRWKTRNTGVGGG